MKCNHISVSRNTTWSQCRQKYKYKYHLQVIPTVPEKDYLTFGKTVHKIIEVYTKDRGHSNINDITDQVLEGDIELEPGVKAELSYQRKKELSVHLSNFMKLSDKIGIDGKVEWKFDIDLNNYGDKINECRNTINDVPRHVTGFVDRLIPKKDHFIVIDYKTTAPGKWRKTRETVVHDLQLQCYAWVIMKTFNVDPKNIITALYYSADGKLVSASFSEKTLQKVPEYLLETYLDIENTSPENVVGKTGNHCNHCDYNNICPFWSNYYAKKF